MNEPTPQNDAPKPEDPALSQDALFQQLSAIEQVLANLSKQVGRPNGANGHVNGNGPLPPAEIPTIKVTNNGTAIRALEPPSQAGGLSSSELMTMRVKVPRNLSRDGAGNPELITIPVKLPRALSNAPPEVLGNVVAQGLHAAAAMGSASAHDKASQNGASQEPPEAKPEPPALNEAVKIGRDISFRDIFFMVRERWMLGLTAGVLCAAAYAYWALSKPKIYEAKAELLIEMQSDKVLPTLQKVEDSNLVESNSLERALQIHDKRLASQEYRDVVTAAYSDQEKAAYVKIAKEEAFQNRARDILSLSDAALFERQFGFSQEFGGPMSVQRKRESQFFTIAYRHRDPAVAQLAANRYVQHYSTYLNSESKMAHDKAHLFLKEQVAQLRDKIASSEREIQEYRKKHQIVENNDDSGQSSTKLTELGKQVTEAEVEIYDLEVQIREIEGVKPDNMAQLMEHPVVAKFSSVPEIKTKLEANQQEFQRLDLKYGSRHPKMIDNRRNREALEVILKQNIQLALADMKNKLSKAKEQRNVMTQALVAAESEHLKAGDPMVEYKVKLRTLELDKAQYDLLLGRMNETALAGLLEDTNIKTVRNADLPGEPVVPDRRKTTRTALLMLLGAFIGLPIAAGFLDTRLKSFSEAQAFLGKECLGVVPEKPRMKGPELAQSVRLAEDEGLVESFRSIYGAMEISSLSMANKVILITSAAPGEGKSFLTCGLATTFSRHGHKVLILDCDLRRPSQHEYSGLDNEAGLLPWLAGTDSPPTSWDDLIGDPLLGLSFLGDNLYLLRSGGSTKTPSESFQTERYERLLQALRRHFDVVIVDSPPVGLFPDALFVARHADETVFVCKHNGVNRNKIKFALTNIDRSPAPVLGTIINQLSASRRHHYDYGYRDYAYGAYDKKAYAKYYRN